MSGWGSDETEGLGSSPSILQYSLDSEWAGGQSDHCFPAGEEFSTPVKVTGHFDFLLYCFYHKDDFTANEVIGEHMYCIYSKYSF